MLYYLFTYLHKQFELPGAGMFNYISFRSAAALITSLLIAMFFGKQIIDFLKRKQVGESVRDLGLEGQMSKQGTPTMGGILIIFSITLSTLIWGDLSNSFVWMCLIVLLVFGITGFADDYMKVKKKTANAMTAKMKLLIQFSTALIVTYFISQATPEEMRHNLYFPYFDLSLNISWFYILFAMIVIAGSSNAVNLSDGLDGLAAGLCIFSFISFAMIALVTGSTTSINLNSVFIPGCKEITIVCAAVAGACLGFLWYNCSPAQVFMGDTGSLALGALLGVIAVMTKREIVLAIIGLVFVIEALSVMIQIFWYKKTKTRIFLMAPIHHHFEQLGWKETTVVTRFWVISFICSIIGLSSLVF